MSTVAPAAAAQAAASPAPVAPRRVTVPSALLAVPQELAMAIAESVSRAATDADDWRRRHRRGDAFLAGWHALAKTGWAPGPEEEKRELETLHAIARQRTPEHTKTAAWFAREGYHELWKQVLADYQAGVGPAQAAYAARLFEDTMNLVNAVTQVAKGSAMRKRPYERDPSLPLVVDKPGNNPSFPSGHTSAAFAAATVMSTLMPQRAQEFMQLALQSAYARVYAGAHFPSDVVKGAYLGTMISSYMVARAGDELLDAAHQRRGSATPAPRRRTARAAAAAATA